MAILLEQDFDTIVLCSNYLEQLSHEHENLIKKYEYIPDDLVVIFNSNHPSITLQNYIKRMFKYLQLRQDDLLYAMNLIEHLMNVCKTRYTYILTPTTIHKLLASSILITLKITDDKFYYQTYYAKIFGMTRDCLTQCEINFLLYIQFSVYISMEIFNDYKHSILD